VCDDHSLGVGGEKPNYSDIEVDDMTRLGTVGLTVPAITVLSPASALDFANCLASASLAKVLVRRAGRGAAPDMSGAI